MSRPVVPAASATLRRAPRVAPLGALRVALTLCALTLAAPTFAQTVDSVQPNALRRGETTEVIVRGSDLGTLTGATISGGTGSGATVSDFAATATLIRFRVGVGATAALGARDVTLAGLAEPLADALTVQPGAIDVLSLTPALGVRGTTATLAVRGSNLDTITAWDFGVGIEVDDFTTESATRGTVTVTIGAAAFSGVRQVTASRTGDSFTLFGAFSVEGGAPTVSRLLPAELSRETTTEVLVEGVNLDQVDTITAGSRVTVESFTVDSPTLARATIRVLPDAAAGPRPVVLRVGEARIDIADALVVTRGALQVTTVRPDRVRQRDVTFLTLEGVNLDGMTSFSAGTGVTVEAIRADQATSASVDIVVADDAPVGFRDLVIVGPAGTVTLEDALVVATYEPPALDVRFPASVEMGDTLVGAIGRTGLTVENVGTQTERVELVPSDGDARLFSLVDPDGLPVSRLAFDVPAGDLVVVGVEFTPDIRGRTGVAYEVLARDGVVVGSVTVRATGRDAELLWSLEPPYDLGVFEPGEVATLPRLDTLLADSVPSEEVLIEGFEVRASVGGEAASEDLLEISFESVLASGDFYWGATEITWSATSEIEGTYVGELLLRTDSPVAPRVPFAFTITFDEDGITDAGGDTGADAGSDVAVDAGGDGGVIIGRDVGVDSGRDVGVDSGADVATDTGATDAGSDALSDASASDASTDVAAPRTGGGGGCSAAPRGGAFGFGLLAAGLLARRRRR